MNGIDSHQLDITDILNRKEPISGASIVDFVYRDKKFQVVAKKLKNHNQSEKDNSAIVSFDVYDDEGLLHGNIIGELNKDISGNLVFYSSSLTNKRVDEDFMRIKKLKDHVPGIVREAIAQILSQQKIYTWISTGTTLLDGGIRTYEALLNDSRFNVTKTQLPEPDSDTGEPRFQYSIQKKTD
jgi:hypothetical protein